MGPDDGIDVLMITYRWPTYVERSLPRLLESATPQTRIWLWHNGDDADTLAAVRRHLGHPAIASFHHSPRNVRLTVPTNWLWTQAPGALLGKVDDDCLVPEGWIETLVQAHLDEARFGIIGSWRFYDEDRRNELVGRKLATFGGGHQLMRNPWVQGSSYLMKRRCVDLLGPLRDGESFTAYALDVAATGFENGWYHPFLHEEHLDDPRSAVTGLKSDADLLDRMPLSARNQGITTLDDWTEQMRRSALTLQTASPDVRDHLSRSRLARARLRRLSRTVTRRARTER